MVQGEKQKSCFRVPNKPVLFKGGFNLFTVPEPCTITLQYSNPVDSFFGMASTFTMYKQVNK